MKSGYKIEWSENSLLELKRTFEYIGSNWTDKEISRLSQKIESTVNLISQNPEIFPKSEKLSVRKAVVTKQNTIYYRKLENLKTIQILSFFNNRMNSNKRNF